MGFARKIDKHTGRGTVGDLPFAAELVAYQRATHRSWRAIAHDVGVSAFALTTYRDGLYKHNPARIGGLIEKFLKAEADDDDTLEIPFVKTTTARQVMEMIALTHVERTMGLVYGPAGSGKTVAAEEYCARTHHSYLITCSPATRGPKAITGEILLAMDESRPSDTLYRNVERIRERLRRQKAVLIFDEAQHLSLMALEQIRALHDAFRVPIVFIGTVLLRDHLMRHGQTDLTQLFSRIGCSRFISGAASADDVVAVLTAAVGKAVAAKLASYATKRAEMIGIRGVVKQLNMAVRRARVAGKPLDLALFKAMEKRMIV